MTDEEFVRRDKQLYDDIKAYHAANPQYSKWQVCLYVADMWEFFSLDFYTVIDTINKVFEEDWKK